MADDKIHSAAHLGAALERCDFVRPAGLAHKSPDISGKQRAALTVIGVTVAARIARDRRTYERLILMAIVLIATRDVFRAGAAAAIARIIAWDKQLPLADSAGRKHHARRGHQRSDLVHKPSPILVVAIGSGCGSFR